MRLAFDTNKDNILVIQDTGRQLCFDVGEYKSSRIKQIQDVLGTANNYLRSMDSRDTDAMFELYIQAMQVLNEQNNILIIDRKLQQIFRDLINIINLERLKRWVQFESGILIPHEIETNFENVDEQYIRGKTYLRHEYIDLLTILVCFRFLLPIWGLYISRIREAVSEFTKELRAYELLKLSAIAEHPAYTRLKHYIDVSFSETVRTASSTIAGIGRDDIPEWLCSMLMIRRLSIVDLTSGNGAVNVVQKVFGYVKDALNNLEKKFKETINTKSAAKKDEPEIDPSFLETYRVKQELPYGLIDSYNVYLSNVYKVCSDIDETITKELVNDVVAHCDGLVTMPLGEHNLLIMQWVMAPVIPPMMIDTLEKVSVTNALIASQALLHHWGMHEVALTVTGINLDTRLNIVGDQLQRITNEQSEILAKLYPFNITDRRDLKAKQKVMDEGSLAITSLSGELIAFRRAVRTPSFVKASDVPTVDQFGYMVTPTNINVLLADVVIKTNLLLRENRIEYNNLMQQLR